MRHVHSQQLERWAGVDEVEKISSAMHGWYGPHIPVSGVPGAVWATRDGDFVGHIKGGGFMSALEYQHDLAKHALARAWKRAGKVRHGVVGAGLSSLSDAISEATVGNKRREFIFYKTGSTGVVNATNDLWFAGGQPAVGASAGAAPGGTAFTSASTGAFGFTNPASGDTQHYVNGVSIPSIGTNALLLYDRIFGVTKTMNSTATEAVTGTPSRYQNTTPGNPDSAVGNFLFVVARTALPATAHNWTTCTYVDELNAASTLPSLTGNSSNIVNRLDHPTGQWFAPLATNDVGIKALTQMQCSAAVASGAIDFIIGHPLAWIIQPLANALTFSDGLNGAFNLGRIFDDAALAFLEVGKGATTATNYTGWFLTLAG